MLVAVAMANDLVCCLRFLVHLMNDYGLVEEIAELAMGHIEQVAQQAEGLDLAKSLFPVIHMHY